MDEGKCESKGGIFDWVTPKERKKEKKQEGAAFGVCHGRKK